MEKPMRKRPPLLRKIDCVRVYVPDLEAALRFYRDALGHELIWRTGTAAGLRLPESDAELVLQTDDPGEEVDFLVEDVTEAVDCFHQSGGSIAVPPFDIPIGKCSVVKDPAGNTIVLLDMSKGKLKTDPDGNVIGIEPLSGCS